ncbi:MAG: T9SS type A sorting domain-containing protein [Candidatus Firestonebacteria bacterium]|nr:T9SS type A sorting domain-containing protein [Candidatus Firestonebacteria bacterium]
MKILILLFFSASLLQGVCSSLTYDLYFEGESSGRISAASSSNYIVSGDLGAFGGGFSSGHYEINNGWYFTVNIDDTPPCAAKNIAAETLLNGNIRLTWNSAVDNESFVKGYRIYRSVRQTENGSLLSELDNTAFTDTAGLIFGITYYYRVQPVDLAGNESVLGNTILPALSKSLSTSVTSLTAVSKSGGKIELSWQPLTGISYYRIYRSEDFGNKGSQVNPEGNTIAGIYSEYLSNGLADGKKYYYTAQGVDNSANEQQLGNNQASAVCDAVPPTLPVPGSSSHPEVSVSADNSPDFFWVEAEDPKAPAGGATGVKGYYYILNRNPVESFSGNWSFKNGLVVSFDKIADGEWYLHVLAEDNAGNQSATASKKISISTSGVICGRVFDTDGKTPLQDARLELMAGLLVFRSDRTDKTGNYTFSKVPFGNYKIKIYKAGFNPCETEVAALSKTSPSVTLDKTISALQNVSADGPASYPNPCRTGTVTFVYRVEVPSEVVIDIYDPAGERVAALESDQTLTGFRETSWDASRVPTGVYYYSVKLRNKGNTIKFPIKKLSIIR